MCSTNQWSWYLSSSQRGGNMGSCCLKLGCSSNPEASWGVEAHLTLSLPPPRHIRSLRGASLPSPGPCTSSLCPRVALITRESARPRRWFTRRRLGEEESAAHYTRCVTARARNFNDVSVSLNKCLRPHFCILLTRWISWREASSFCHWIITAHRF